VYQVGTNKGITVCLVEVQINKNTDILFFFLII